MNDRCWGEIKDREAARQLGLSDEHTIFMMSTDVECTDEIEAVAAEFAELGYVDPSEVLDAVQERIRHVPLPRGLVLVGMVPLGRAEPKTYGIVDLSAVSQPATQTT